MWKRAFPVFVLLFPTVWGAQDPDITIEVERVNLLVTVVDKKGRFVTDLKKERFEVFEDGKRQTLTNFAPQTNLPLQIGLMLDTSMSIRTQLDFEKEAASNFVYSVMQSQDKALVVEFDRGVNLIQDFTNRPNVLATSIRDLKAGGGTALMDAIYWLTREKMNSGSARKVIVIVSDGMDRHSEKSKTEALKIVQENNVVLYAIGTNHFAADQRDKGKKVLEDLADRTGGQAFFPYSADRLHEAFDSVNQELRSQYILAYSSTNTNRDGQFRKIKVKLKKSRGLKTRHRSGYYATVEEGL